MRGYSLNMGNNEFYGMSKIGKGGRIYWSVLRMQDSSERRFCRNLSQLYMESYNINEIYLHDSGMIYCLHNAPQGEESKYLGVLEDALWWNC